MCKNLHLQLSYFISFQVTKRGHFEKFLRLKLSIGFFWVVTGGGHEKNPGGYGGGGECFELRVLKKFLMKNNFFLVHYLFIWQCCIFNEREYLQFPAIPCNNKHFLIKQIHFWVTPPIFLPNSYLFILWTIPNLRLYV